MPNTIKTGTILIKEGTPLPEAALGFETEPCAPSWTLLKNLDGYGVNRKIDEAGWTFFCLAGEIKATVFGFDAQKAARRAVKRILARLKGEGFNSLEVTAVASQPILGDLLPSDLSPSPHNPVKDFLVRCHHLPVRDQARLAAA